METLSEKVHKLEHSSLHIECLLSYSEGSNIGYFQSARLGSRTKQTLSSAAITKSMVRKKALQSMCDHKLERPYGTRLIYMANFKRCGSNWVRDTFVAKVLHE